MAEAGNERERSPRETYLLRTLDRHAKVVAALRQAAEDAGAPDACLAWMGVQRQAERYLRDLRPWFSGRRRLEGVAGELDAHRQMLESAVGAAQHELDAADDATREAARRRLGIRVAVVGKGGAGKTMISATFTRLLARRGRRVLAADLDTNPGLAFSLGLGLGPDRDGVPTSVEEIAGAPYGWQLASDVTPSEAVERHAVMAPDGVRFLSLGKIDEPEKTAAKQTVVAVRQILSGFGEPDWDVLGDMEAGPTTPFERYHSFADHVVVVVGPAWRSALTARRLLPIVGDVPVTIVANRFRDEPDHPGLEPAVRVPYDAEVGEAERQGLAPIDVCPHSPAVKAVEQLAELFLPQEVSL